MRTIRSGRAVAALAIAGLLLAACAAQPAEPVVTETGAAPSDVQALAEQAAAAAFDEHKLGSVVVQVRVDGDVVAEVAQGEAMAGVPVTVDGHFRNGAIAITYIAVTMLRMAEDGRIDLDKPISTWLPDLPDADRVTPRMLATMTSGYPDYEPVPAFTEAQLADPFRSWTRDDLLAYTFSEPRAFEPGENWGYSHAGIVILGHVLEVAGEAPLDALIDEYVLAPLALTETTANQTAAMPEPVNHAFTGERGIFEESTFWNPSWTLAPGAVQTTTIDDAASSFDALLGRGELLSPEAYAELIAGQPDGMPSNMPGCAPNCPPLSFDHNYGTGVMLVRDWTMQAPIFGGYASTVMTLPEERSDARGAITVGVAVTYTEATFADWGDSLSNMAQPIAFDIATQLVPDKPPALPAQG